MTVARVSQYLALPMHIFDAMYINGLCIVLWADGLTQIKYSSSTAYTTVPQATGITISMGFVSPKLQICTA